MHLTKIAWLFSGTSINLFNKADLGHVNFALTYIFLAGYSVVFGMNEHQMPIYKYIGYWSLQHVYLRKAGQKLYNAYKTVHEDILFVVFVSVLNVFVLENWRRTIFVVRLACLI